MNAPVSHALLAASLLAGPSFSFAAEVGARVVNSPIPVHELNMSPAYTPQNGYTGNLTLLGAPLPAGERISAAERAEALDRVARLRALILSAQEEARALDAKLVATEVRLKELEAERQALRERREAVGKFINEKLVPAGPLKLRGELAPVPSRP